MVRLFKDLSLPSLLIVLVYGLLLHLNLFLYPTNWEASAYGTLLYQWLANGINWLTQGNVYIQAGLFVVFAFIQGLLLNRLINQHELTQGRNTLAAAAYLLFLAFFNQTLLWSPAFLAAFPILISLTQLFKSFDNKKLSYLFDAGFFIGVATLIYPPSLFLVVALALTYLVIRVFAWREWVVTPMGLLLPFYFMGVGLLFVPYEILVEYFYNWLPHLQILNFGHLLTINGLIILGIFLILVLLNFWFFRLMYLKIPIQTRRLLTKAVYFVLAGLLALIFCNNVENEPFVLIALPLSLLSAFLLYEQPKSLYAEIGHLIVLIGLVLVQYVF